MNDIELFYSRMAMLLGSVVVLYLLYRLVRLLTPRANIFQIKENGKFRQEGFVKYKSFDNRYNAYDIMREFADQHMGEVQVGDDGKAWVRLKKDNEQPDAGYEPIGYIDLSGIVYDKDHCRVGYVGTAPGQSGMNGKRKWYELFLRCHAYTWLFARQEQVCSNAGDTALDPPAELPQDRCVGKCIETGRFRRRRGNEYTALGRAAAFLLLYHRVRPVKARPEEFTVERSAWCDTALISVFIFAILFAIFYFGNITPVSFPFLGDTGFTLSLFLLYFAVWFLARQVKIEQSLNGKPIGHFLMLFNRNTGLSGVGNVIMLITAAGLALSVYLGENRLIPLQAAILTGMWVNKKYITRIPWKVHTKFMLPPPAELDEDEDTANKIARSYHWELDSDDTTLQGEMTLHFAQAEIDDLRSRNPFRTEASLDFDRNMELLFKEQVNETHLKRINHYITRKAYEENLSALETMQFILDFVQEPNIKYLTDSESPETGNVEYARFPDETLFDQHGDCDCKAVLAAALFRNAGYKVAYVTSHNHAAVAVACPKEWFSYYHTDQLYAEKQALTDREGHFYYFCETTSDSFRIGDYGNSHPREFKNVKYLA